MNEEKGHVLLHASPSLNDEEKLPKISVTWRLFKVAAQKKREIRLLLFAIMMAKLPF